MKERINRNIGYFIIIYIIILIVCFGFTKGYALIDHYNMFNKGYVRYAIEEFFKDGRIFSGIYILIANLLKVKIQHLYIFSIIIGIGIVVFNILYFKEIIKNQNDSSKNWQWIVLSLITVFNWTCINNMNYIEFPIIALSIFLYMYSAKKFVIDKNIKLSLLAMTFAIFCYQGTLSTYFSTIVLFSILKHEKFKETLKDIGKGYLLGLIPIIINFIFIRIYGNIINLSTRTNLNFEKIMYNLKELKTVIEKIVVYSTFALPKYVFLIFIAIIIVIAVLFIKKDKNIVLKIVIISLINVISCIPIIIIFYKNDVNIPARLLWSIGAIIGMCLIILYSEIKSINWKVIIIYLSIAYMIFQLYGMNHLIYRMKLGNEIDKSICKQLEELRLKIKEEDNIDIEKIIIKEEFTRKWITGKIQQFKLYTIIYSNFSFTYTYI